VLVKDRFSPFLKLSSRLLLDKILRVLEPNKFPAMVALTQSNVQSMCDPPGGQPCVILVVPEISEALFRSAAFAEFRKASERATKASTLRSTSVPLLLIVFCYNRAGAAQVLPGQER
jgi:hypothetical protein